MRDDLSGRLDRVEAMLAIQQLPVRYALAVDGRDIETWISLFIDDVDCGARGKGREVLRSIITPAVSTFYRSIHFICGHEIDLSGGDRATGRVYCRAEHEDRGKWYVMAICYHDEYERRDGQWLFTRRRERHWYAADIAERPQAPFTGWPGHEASLPRLPAAFPTWGGFWQDTPPEKLAELTAQPVESERR